MLKVATVIAILAIFSLGVDHGCDVSTSDRVANDATIESSSAW